MRKLNIGTNRFTEVYVGDEPDEGGACHEYNICRAESLDDTEVIATNEFGFVKFQKGPVKEVGVNGCYQEDLIAIVIDRLQGFQAGEFACSENEQALISLKKALSWLNARTRARAAQGVEGTNQHRS